jgi:hypothetical protein
LVVERTAVDLGDTKAGVERAERGIERTRTVVENTKAGVERTEKGVERTEKVVELTKAGVNQLYVHQNVKDQIIERQKIIDWICPTEIDYIDQQNALMNRRQRGIGEWFLETQEYESWLQGDRATLLCSGKPGAGKTMTTSFVVNNVLGSCHNDDQIGVAYVYCQYSRHKEQTPEYLMSSILRQLLEQHNTMSDEVRASYKSKNEGKQKLAPYETSDLLNVVLNLFTKTFIIVDALDELRSTDCNAFVSQVLAIQQKFSVNVYATSRYMDAIAEEAPNATQVDIRAREEEMRCSLNLVLRHGYLLSKRPDLQEQALAKILHLADGMYVTKIILRHRSGGFQSNVFIY